MIRRYALLPFLLSLCLCAGAQAAERHDNHFASILVDGKKIGHAHYTVSYNEEGEIEDLKARASLSVFGVKLYSYAQDTHENWRAGKLRSMRGRTDDDGDIDEVALLRNATHYEGEHNGEAVTIPEGAFPNSVWHHQITQERLLFNIVNLRLMEVFVTRVKETIVWGGEKVATDRFDFAGDWSASIWYDQSKRFLQARYKQDRHEIFIVLDP